MVSSRLYRNIIFRVLFLAVIALITGWAWFEIHFYLLALMLALVFVIQTIELIGYLNRTNRKIAFFFDAIRNDDSTLYFPKNTGNKWLDELNASLNKVNRHIKKIRFELQEQEQYFKSILENVSTGVITFNDKGNIFLANEAARNLLNRDQLTHIDQIKMTDLSLFTSIQELKPGDSRLVRFAGKSGIVQLSLKSTLFKTAQERFMLIAMQDIKNEMEIKELESWSKLIRVLAHEIMNTIAPITSLTQTISGYYKNRDDGPPSEKVIANTIKGLDAINERGNELINFVENYRKLTRIPTPVKKPVVIAQIFENIITLLDRHSETEGTKILTEENPAGMKITVDKKQITQVLLNLVKNALDALENRENGEVRIHAGLNECGQIRITITDNGPGIPYDLMDQVFIPFFTTRETGSGIGLSLSKQIMILHGGTLKLVSVPGKYTRAILDF